MSLKKIGQPEPFKCKCGCHVLDGVIVKICETAKAGFGIMHIAAKVDGNTKVWINMINAEIQKHSKLVIDESKKEKSKIIRP